MGRFTVAQATDRATLHIDQCDRQAGEGTRTDCVIAAGAIAIAYAILAVAKAVEQHDGGAK